MCLPVFCGFPSFFCHGGDMATKKKAIRPKRRFRRDPQPKYRARNEYPCWMGI